MSNKMALDALTEQTMLQQKAPRIGAVLMATELANALAEDGEGVKGEKRTFGRATSALLKQWSAEYFAAQPSQAVQAGEPTSDELKKLANARGRQVGSAWVFDAIGLSLFISDIRTLFTANADRASSGATTQAVRMLTTEEIADCCNGLMRDNSAIETWIRRAVKKAFAVNNLRIPASGEIGSAA